MNLFMEKIFKMKSQGLRVTEQREKRGTTQQIAVPRFFVFALSYLQKNFSFLFQWRKSTVCVAKTAKERKDMEKITWDAIMKSQLAD